MPRLIRLYIVQVVAGFGLSALFVAMLLWLDVARLGSLIRGSDVGLVALIMLWVFNGIVFAGVQFGLSVMRLAQDDTSGGGGRRQARALRPAVAAVRVIGPDRSRR